MTPPPPPFSSAVKQTAWNPCLSTSSSHQTQTPPATPTSYPQIPIFCHSPSVLLSSVLLLPTFLPHPSPLPSSCAFILSHPRSKRSWPYMKRGDIGGLYPPFPRREPTKTELTDWRNRSGNLSVSPSVSLSLSLSLSLSQRVPILIPFSLAAFISVLCLTYFEMPNLPPRSELIIKSERMQGPAPWNEKKRGR